MHAFARGKCLTHVGLLIMSVLAQSIAFEKLGQVELVINPDSAEINKHNVTLICKIECIRRAHCKDCYAGGIDFKQQNSVLRDGKFQRGSRRDLPLPLHLNNSRCPMIEESLTITRLNLSDGGVYSCEAFSSTREILTSNHAFLMVYGPLTVTHATTIVTSKLSQIQTAGRETFYFNKTELISKQQIDLKCSIPMSTKIRSQQIFASWSQNEKPIDCNLRTNINCSMVQQMDNSSDNFTTHLQFTEIFPPDIGKYECIFKAEKPFLKAAVHLRSAPLVQVHFDNSEMLSPVEGQMVLLQCQIHAHPPANLTWRWNRGDDSILPNSTEFLFKEIQVNGSLTKQDLLLTSVQKDNRAIYVCSAVNDLDSAESAILLRVRDKMALVYPLIGIALELCTLFLVIIITECFLHRTRLNDEEKKTSQVMQMALKSSCTSVPKPPPLLPPTETPTLQYIKSR